MLLPLSAIQTHGKTKAQLIVDALCDTYKGVFYWYGSRTPQYVSYYLRDKSIEDGTITVMGSGTYVDGSGPTFIKFQWQIDATSHRISIKESEPTSSTFITDGTYEGSISHDLSKVITIWETRSTGTTGTLTLEADKSCQPQNLS